MLIFESQCTKVKGAAISQCKGGVIMEPENEDVPCFVIIKSAPGTAEAARGLEVARDTASDIILVGKGIWLGAEPGTGGPGGLKEFCGTVYARADDLPAGGELNLIKGIKVLGAGEFEALVGPDSVLGTF